MKRILPILVVAGSALAPVAHAATMTTAMQTITFGPGLTEFANADAQLSLFDSTLGTLDSVTIGGTYGFTSNLTITNTAAGASSGSVRTESASAFNGINPTINRVLESLLDISGSATVGGTTLNPAAFDVFGHPASYSLASGAQTTAVSNANTVTVAPASDSNVTDLAAFEAPSGGLFDVLFNTATATLLSNTGGNTSAAEVTTATGTVNIYYTYDTLPPPPPTDTPEPASIALLGMGLFCTGLFRRSRR